MPFAITEIYGIRTSGKYAGLAGEYTENEFYRVYGNTPSVSFKPDVIISEDSNAGYDFWSNAVNACKCVSANGKANILNTLKRVQEDEKKYLAIADGAAFGSEIEEIIQYMKYSNASFELYAPESFEYLILSSGLFRSAEISDKCTNTSEYADSIKYMSWEQFYTALLVEVTDRSIMKYSKHKLNMYYLSEKNRSLVLKELPDVLSIRGT